MPNDADITGLLVRFRQGDSDALNRLFPSVYTELRRIADRQLRRAWDVDTINATAIVHEAYERLVQLSDVTWQDRAHFFAVSATAMRQIVINYAVRKRAKKRGGDYRRVTFDSAEIAAVERTETLLALDAALKQLAELDGRLAKVVEYRFFGGLTEVEIACVLAVTERTVRRDWKKAKALLAQYLMAPTLDEWLCSPSG